MEPEIIFGDWYICHTNNGDYIVPAEFEADLSECVHGEIESVEKVESWGARLSMPGYLDCTDWDLYDSEDEAREGLEEMYG